MRGLQASFLVVVASLLLSACTPAQATLEVRVQDHEIAIDQFQSTEVTISGLAIHPAGTDWESNWQPLLFEPITLDLTQFVGGPYAVIFDQAASTGTFDGVRLEVDESSGVLKDGSTVEIHPPEFSALSSGFEVLSGQKTILLLDLVVVGLEDHPEGGYGLQFQSVSWLSQ